MTGLALTRLAVRDLWSGFRMLVLLVLPALAGSLALLPVNPRASHFLLAWGIAAAAAGASGIVAGAWAGERRSGIAAWLSLRTLPRASMAIAWFAGFAMPFVVGACVAGALPLLAASPFVRSQDSAYWLLFASAVAGSLQALAIGLIFGSLLRPLAAATLAITASLGLLGAGLAIAPEPVLVPTAGLGLVARAWSLSTPLADGLQALGLGLAMTGLLLWVGVLAFQHVDL